jgi:hypothetical protein
VLVAAPHWADQALGSRHPADASAGEVQRAPLTWGRAGVWDGSFTMAAMDNLVSVLDQLERERIRLASQLERLNNALSALNVKGSSQRGKISAAGRARIAAAQRARWAKAKGKKVVFISRHKRRISPAARKRIAAVQKARWAKWRRQKSA